MSSDIMIAVGLLAVAFVLSAMLSIPLMFRLDINRQALLAQIEKLVQAQNNDRAVKLCNAAPNVAIAGGIKAMIVALSSGVTDIGSLHKAFDDGLPSLFHTIQKLRILGLVSVALVALAGVELMRAPSGFPAAIWVGFIVVLGSVVIAELKLAKIKSDIQIAKDEIAPLLVKTRAE